MSTWILSVLSDGVHYFGDNIDKKMHISCISRALQTHISILSLTFQCHILYTSVRSCHRLQFSVILMAQTTPRSPSCSHV